jgi:hypothetical protein
MKRALLEMEGISFDDNGPVATKNFFIERFRVCHQLIGGIVTKPC